MTVPIRFSSKLRIRKEKEVFKILFCRNHLQLSSKNPNFPSVVPPPPTSYRLARRKPKIQILHELQVSSLLKLRQQVESAKNLSAQECSKSSKLNCHWRLADDFKVVSTSKASVCRLGSSASYSGDVTERPDSEVGEERSYPEGKPSWEQLQHVALRLADSVPKFFSIQQDYTFYRQDVELINRIQGVVVRGIRLYWYHLATLRLLAAFRYIHASMKVLNITPVMEDGTVRMRWRVENFGFFAGLIAFVKHGKNALKYANWLDGYAIFFLDGSGLVYRVVIDRVRFFGRVMPDDEKSKKKKTIAEKLAAAIGKKAVAGAPTTG